MLQLPWVYIKIAHQQNMQMHNMHVIHNEQNMQKEDLMSRIKKYDHDNTHTRFKTRLHNQIVTY